MVGKYFDTSFNVIFDLKKNADIETVFLPDCGSTGRACEMMRLQRSIKLISVTGEPREAMPFIRKGLSILDMEGTPRIISAFWSLYHI
jgi:hypothetical protein